MTHRRLLIATAVTQYQHEPGWDRPELAQDVDRMSELLCGEFGYSSQTILPLDPTGVELPTRLRRFAKRSCTSDDYVVLYLAGHGEFTAAGEHIFLPHDADPEDLLEHSVKTGDLAEWMLAETPLRRLMVIIDSCYSGAGGVAVTQRALGVLTEFGVSRDRCWGGGCRAMVDGALATSRLAGPGRNLRSSCVTRSWHKSSKLLRTKEPHQRCPR